MLTVLPDRWGIACLCSNGEEFMLGLDFLLHYVQNVKKYKIMLAI